MISSSNSISHAISRCSIWNLYRSTSFCRCSMWTSSLPLLRFFPRRCSASSCASRSLSWCFSSDIRLSIQALTSSFGLSKSFFLGVLFSASFENAFVFVSFSQTLNRSISRSICFRACSISSLSRISGLDNHPLIWSRYRCNRLISFFRSASCFSLSAAVGAEYTFCQIDSNSTRPSWTRFRTRSISDCCFLVCAMTRATRRRRPPQRPRSGCRSSASPRTYQWLQLQSVRLGARWLPGTSARGRRHVLDRRAAHSGLRPLVGDCPCAVRAVRNCVGCVSRVETYKGPWDQSWLRDDAGAVRPSAASMSGLVAYSSESDDDDGGRCASSPKRLPPAAAVLPGKVVGDVHRAPAPKRQCVVHSENLDMIPPQLRLRRPNVVTEESFRTQRVRRQHQQQRPGPSTPDK